MTNSFNNTNRKELYAEEDLQRLEKCGFSAITDGEGYYLSFINGAYLIETMSYTKVLKTGSRAEAKKFLKSIY